MQTTTHESTELREKFQEWLDTYQPNRLKEIDVAPKAWLLECLANCGDTLPADYCDQLEMTNGSNYAQAVVELRCWYSHLRAKEGDDFIGHDTWWIDGMPVTPRMRRAILKSAAELYLAHGQEHREWRYFDEGQGGRVVLTDKKPHYPLMSDFLESLNGECDWRNRSWLLTYGNDLYEWMQGEFFIEAWQGSYEILAERDDDYCGHYHAADRVFEWLEPTACQDIVNWYKATSTKTEAAQ